MVSVDYYEYRPYDRYNKRNKTQSQIQSFPSSIIFQNMKLHKSRPNSCNKLISPYLINKI
jgi:hypothetical protein